MTTSRDTGTQHKLRMPPELKEKLFESAKDMNRSLNAEIVARLEESFSPKASNPYFEMLKYKEEMEAQTKILQENHRALVEQNEKQAKILAELKEFQAWKSQQKKPT